MELATIMGELSQIHASWRDLSDEYGKQIIVSFENGWSASIILSPVSYEVELAVLDRHNRISYDTPITDDVLGHLTPETLKAALVAIAFLPEASL